MNEKPQFFIGIELTRHCNLRCAHCFRADLDKFSEISFETVERILDQCQAYNNPHVALTGGEASLHTQFSEILDLMVSKNYSFHFVTNGFQHQKIFNKISHLFAEPLWTGISLSLDGATAETHDAIRGAKSFKNALASLSIVKSMGKEVVVQMVVHRGNRHEMNAMAQLCSQLKADRLHIAHMQATPHAVKHGLLHSPQEYREVEQEVFELGSQFQLPIYMSAGFYDVTPFAHCKFLKNAGLNIDHRGRLTSCCQLSNYEGVASEKDVIADLNEVSLKDAHQKLLETYHQVHMKRVQKKHDGSFQDLDHFHCWSCLKEFNKVDWMAQYPDNEWVEQDHYFSKPLKTLEIA